MIWLALAATASLCAAAVSTPSSDPPQATSKSLVGFITNSPVVYQAELLTVASPQRNPLFTTADNPIFKTLSNRLSPERFERYMKSRLSQPEYVTNVMHFTNRIFDHFLPESLSQQVWTHFLARTNGRVMRMWAERSHPVFWPANPPSVRWQTNCVIYGMKGFTALSPCWELEGSPGQAPVTLLTRRHGYARGHGMGAEGLKNTFRGRRVWFLTAADEVVEARVGSAVTRASADCGDYTILMFQEDLPPSIQPLRVVDRAELDPRYPRLHQAPYLVLMPEQEGNVDTGLPGFSYPSMKGGDSGAPNLLPFFDELVFYGGRSTSGASQKMQEDIDALCKKEKVSPVTYQLRWVDLSRFPKYSPRP